MSKRKLTDSQIVETQKLYDKGSSYAKVASVFGVTDATVYRWLNPEYRKKKLLYDVERSIVGKEQRQVYRTAYYKENRQKECLYTAEYRKTHLSEKAAHNSARRAMIVGATLGNLAEIVNIYKRAKEAPKIWCYLCGRLIPLGHRHVDHIMPLSKGGQHRPSNLAVACDSCNERKSNKMPEEMGVLL